MGNKKIKGATAVELENIKFKSKLERSCYIRFKEAGLNVIYEPEKFRIWEGCRLENIQVLAFQPSVKRRKEVEATTRPLLPITYTPDFLLQIGNIYYYFDAKGFANDRYPMKKKMFLKHLGELHRQFPWKRYCFFEIQNIAQLLYTIQLIKNMTPVEQIKSLVEFLPEKDKTIAKELIITRDFKSLWELVHSCIIRLHNDSKKEVPNPKYQNLDIEKIQTLEAEVSNYQTLIDPSWMDGVVIEEEVLQDEEH